jgi:putative aldouronate transport system permease protein
VRHSTSDRIIHTLNFLGLCFYCALVLYPIYLVVIASVSDPIMVNTGNVFFWVRGFQLDGYKKILEYRDLWQGYLNTIIYVSLYIALGVSMTLAAGYALSRTKLVFRSFFTLFCIITMYAHGGMIPLYLVVKKLGLIDSMWSVILFQSVMVFNLLVTRTFFQTTIPEELYDASTIDGANDAQVFFRIVLPVSTAIIVVQVLYYGVAQWNNFFKALIFIRSKEKYPLQLVLREILLYSRAADEQVSEIDLIAQADQAPLSEVIRYGVIVVSSIPIIALYPFLQRFFVKGVMIGSVKS